jgi:hypothetical protein
MGGGRDTVIFDFWVMAIGCEEDFCDDETAHDQQLCTHVTNFLCGGGHYW